MKVNTLETAVKVFNRYEEKHDIIRFYFGLLAYHGLAMAADAGKNEELVNKCKDYLALYPDKFEHPYYNFEAYRAGGAAKAWMFMKGYMPEEAEVLREYADITMNSPHNEDGILCHPKLQERIWIDTVAFVTPYMLYTGLALGEQKYIDYAADLCFRSYNVFLDNSNGLLHQAKGFLENPERVSSDFWGRGNGWGYVGLTELVQYLPEDSPHREKALKLYMDHTDAILEYQTERGLWRQILNEELAWYECTGTGLFLYGIGVGIRCGILKGEKYMEALKKGVEALGKYCITTEYMTVLSCPGCLCPGQGKEKGTAKAYITEKYPQDDEVHSYGCIMFALVEAYKNGIEEIELFEFKKE